VTRTAATWLADKGKECARRLGRVWRSPMRTSNGPVLRQISVRGGIALMVTVALQNCGELIFRNVW
jgi:hypothetical protein